MAEMVVTGLAVFGQVVFDLTLSGIVRVVLPQENLPRSPSRLRR